MKEIDHEGQKKFTEHFLNGQNTCKEMQKELAALESYLKRLSNYANKYNRIKEKDEREEKIGLLEKQKDLPSCETCYSVKEDVVEERTPIEIVVRPSEPITIISHSKKKDFHPLSNDSEIGIYFIQDVVPINFINVIERELVTLNNLSPSVGCIVHEMKKEFDHFKVCCGCLKQVSSLLPDILKELQELIKFIKKKRNESYFWPNDSDYLRKSNKKLKETFQSNIDMKKMKQIVDCATIHSEYQDKLGEVDSFVLGDHVSNRKSGYQMRRYSMRLADCPQLSIFRSETQNELSLFEKLETIDKDNTLVTNRNETNKLFLNELSTAQIMRILHPMPAVEKAIQLQITGIISCSTTDNIEGIPIDREESDKHAAVKEDLLTTIRIAMEETCATCQQKAEMEMEKELKANMRDLKDLMIEAHKNQIKLSKVLFEKGLLNAVFVQLTDPKLLNEEKVGIEKAKNILSDEEKMLEKPSEKQLQCLVEDLKRRCNVKNRMIIALLNGLRSNVPKQHWQELLHHVLCETGTENLDDFFQQNTSLTSDHHQLIASSREWQTRTKKEFGFEEITVEKEIKKKYERDKKSEGDNTKISVSEVISKTSNCLQMTESDCKLTVKTSLSPLKSSLLTVYEMPDLNPGSEKFLRNLNSEIKSTINDENQSELKEVKPINQTMGIKTRNREILESETELATINLTIKIGNEETLSQYMSAMSVIPTRTTLKEIKSEMSVLSFPEREPIIDFVAGDSSNNRKREMLAFKSLTNLILKLKLPLSFRENDESKNFKAKHTPKETFLSTKPNTESLFKLTSELKQNIYADYICDQELPNESLTEKIKTDIQKNISPLHSQINIYFEHIMTMEELQSRLRLLEDCLRNLTRKIDRMNILADKLVDDAYESSKNFNDLYNRCSVISDSLNI